MVGHLFQNYDTIYVQFFPRILAIIPDTRYTCVFLSRILAFYSKVYDHFLTNAHIYAHLVSKLFIISLVFLLTLIARSTCLSFLSAPPL